MHAVGCQEAILQNKALKGISYFNILRMSRLLHGKPKIICYLNQSFGIANIILIKLKLTNVLKICTMVSKEIKRQFIRVN